ncbi:hypothetical protein BJ165DRAFT_1468723 [Panaeolus papilionaceus]|nr:hypothetical protein BJ165DRAFT_1468723 [Panaeolus papilionaceus]
MVYFKQNWPKDLQTDVLESAKSIFKDRYDEIHGSSVTPQRPHASHIGPHARKNLGFGSLKGTLMVRTRLKRI